MINEYFKETDDLVAVYYPTSFIPDRVLKSSLFYFDRIKVFNDDFPREKSSNEFLNETKVLQDEGVLLPISLKIVNERFGEIISDFQSKGEYDSEECLAFRSYGILLMLTSALGLSMEHIDKSVVGLKNLLYVFLSNGEIPITNLEAAQDIFLRDSSKDLEKRVGIAEKLKAKLLLKSVFDQHLPSFELKSYEDVLEARYRLNDELIQIRKAIADVAAQVKVNPLADTEKFIAEGTQQIDSTVNDLKRKIRTSRNRFFRKAIQESMVSALAITASATTGIPIPLLFALNSAKNIVDEYGSLVEKRKEIQEENSLSFLISLKKKLS